MSAENVIDWELYSKDGKYASLGRHDLSEEHNVGITSSTWILWGLVAIDKSDTGRLFFKSVVDKVFILQAMKWR